MMQIFVGMISGILIGAGSAAWLCEYSRPAFKAEVTTRATYSPESNPSVTIPEFRLDLMAPPPALLAGAGPDGNAAMIRLDGNGRVIAKCEADQ